MKVDLDKFYTKAEIAKKCIDSVTNISGFDTIIEPSAGTGSFSRQIKNCIAFDIEPENNQIIRQDFFTLDKVEGDKILFIGNPPFGQRAALAKKFIRHAIELGADTIAFILPNTFSKVSNQSVTIFPKEWKLISVSDLGADAFSANGGTYHVPCSFYIWTKSESEIDLRKSPLPNPKEFSFLPRGDQNADFVINGNSAKVRDIADVTNPKSEHYVRINGQSNKTQFKILFSKLRYQFNSSCNGGNAWISQQEIIDAYLRYSG